MEIYCENSDINELWDVTAISKIKNEGWEGIVDVMLFSSECLSSMLHCFAHVVLYQINYYSCFATAVTKVLL